MNVGIFFMAIALLIAGSAQLWPPATTIDMGGAARRLAGDTKPVWMLSKEVQIPRAFRLAACSFQWQMRKNNREEVPPASVLSNCPLLIAADHHPPGLSYGLSIRIDCPQLWRWDDYASIATQPEDEAYTLDVSVAGETIARAQHPLGIAWALQTLLQLMERTATGDLAISGLPVHIADTPLLPYRGLLVDAARFHLSPAFLRRLLLWMSSTKLNVLHWHLSDDEAFPIRLDSAPELALRDVEGEEHGIYTKDDLDEIVTMARAHGIRVIPEFDVPGHAGGWTGISDLVARCPGFACSNGWSVTLSSDAASVETLSVVLGELFDIFPDPFVHLGGDEVDVSCWQEALRNHVRARKEFCEFEKKLHSIVRLRGKKVIRWQEHWEQTAEPECAYVRADAYQMWRNFYPSREISLPAAEAGKHLISSVDWYLDANCFEWDTCWSTDPFKYLGLRPETSASVAGGEACVWEFSEAMWNEGRQPFRAIYAIAGRLWISPWTPTPSPAEDIRESIVRACHNAADRGLLSPDNCKRPAPSVPLSATKSHKEDRARRKQRLCKRFKAIH